MEKILRKIRKRMPVKMKMFLMGNLFGLFPDEMGRPGKVIRHNRMILSQRYIRGDGIEIGGLGRPLPVPPGARVKYVDRFDEEGVRDSYATMPRDKEIVRPDIVDDGERLDTVADRSQDFVIANHVIEHFQNPILFLHNAARVLKQGGILYMAIPDKEKTFDRGRPVTPFEHLVEDFENGPEASCRGHYEEFVRLAEEGGGKETWTTEAEYENQVRKLLAENYSIHFHVWDLSAMLEMIVNLRTMFGLPLVPKAMLSTGNEVIFILEKCAAKAANGSDARLPGQTAGRGI